MEIAALKEVRKVKSIQIFRKPAQQAIQGKDREAFRTLVESLVQMTTFISQIFMKLVELKFIYSEKATKFCEIFT